MPIYTITYQKLSKGNKAKYKELEDELAKQRCFKLAEGLWLGSYSNNATQLHQWIKSALDRDDPLMVAELPAHFCYSSMSKGCNRWLELNPPEGGLKDAHVPPPVHPPKEEAPKGKVKAAKAGR